MSDRYRVVSGRDSRYVGRDLSFEDASVLARKCEVRMSYEYAYRVERDPTYSTPNASAAEFKPTHLLRERGNEVWIEVRADGTEPQTYYDRDGKTIYAGIWFQHMEVERLTPPTTPGEQSNG